MNGAIKTHFPAIVLLLVLFILGVSTYQDYGVTWDDPEQRTIGLVSYDYIVNNDTALLTFYNKDYGPGFELFLVFVEKQLNISDSRDIYLMRHIATHLYFLVAVGVFYFLAFSLFRQRFVAIFCLLMLALAPRIYAHSFFNTKDIPFLSATVIAMAAIVFAIKGQRTLLFVLAGLLCGYATGIRVMGAMLAGYMAVFLVWEIACSGHTKVSKAKGMLHMALFGTTFCLALYSSWPYLWEAPVTNFVSSFKAMSHFRWVGNVFVNGVSESSAHLPWFLFPLWFAITNPVLWLLCGLAGIAWFVMGILRHPQQFLKDSNNHMVLFCLLCFATPVAAVIVLHAVVYEDCRHLFFVYPPFVIMAGYFVSYVHQTRYKVLLSLGLLVQASVTGYTMFRVHPLSNVYFNPLVDHSNEYLRKHYEMDYWGVSAKQGIEYLLRTDQRAIITVTADRATMMPLVNNTMLLQLRDRQRVNIVATDGGADYFMTDFRVHPEDYDFPDIYYSVRAFNSTVLRIYKLKK